MRRERENLGKNLSLLLIFKFPSATEIDEICRGVCVLRNTLKYRSKQGSSFWLAKLTQEVEASLITLLNELLSQKRKSRVELIAENLAKQKMDKIQNR